MTFYEAAVEVLRRSGRPLHFKKITEVALRDELLSHVGKTPESTMEDRLDLETKKDDASWIVRTRPGVYMLKGDVAERLNDEAKARDEENRIKREEAKKKKQAKAPVIEEDSEVDDVDDTEDDEEVDDSDDSEADEDSDDADEDEDEDDDENEAANDASSDSDDDGEGRGRRGRRRRRRGRRRSGSGDAPSDTATAKTEVKTNGQVAPAAERAEKVEKPRKAEKPEKAEKAEPSEKRGRRRGRSSDKPAKLASFDDLEGERFESIADAAFAVLNANNRKPISAANVAKVVFDKKLVKFHTHDPEATIESAMVTDNQVRARGSRRPLFAQYRDARWGLTQWGVSDEGVEKEQQILALAAELRQESHDQLGEAVGRLKSEAFEMVVMTLLERLDYRNLKVSKRTSDGDMYFSADWRRGFSDLRVCVRVLSDAESTLEATAVKELRETFEHYAAAEGIIVHIGEVSKDAVRESRKDDVAKVTIIDRKALVRLLIDEGIGVRTFQTPLVMVDTAFIDALQR